ncbi:hypothetical protein ACQEU8_35070 [Streptomyces sp. CA-250714]|uniref:hypothetical protein n=1 Tax=Streptomyces sp. CA-250714 TaxID=3240060 RepID=UPI003D947B9A
MRQLRVITVAFAAVLSALLMQAPASAAPPPDQGEWKDLGEHNFYTGTGSLYYPWRAATISSDGGDFRFCIRTSTSEHLGLHQLREEDADGSSERVKNVDAGPDGCATVPNLDSFVDGDDNRAEFYIRTNLSRAIAVHYYD